MSCNLTLRPLYLISLYQTPTEVTRAAQERGYAQAKEVYFAFLDKWVEQQRPSLPIRASNAQRKAVMSTSIWKVYETFRAQIAKHKMEVEALLVKGATWGCV